MLKIKSISQAVGGLSSGKEKENFSLLVTLTLTHDLAAFEVDLDLSSDLLAR